MAFTPRYETLVDLYADAVQTHGFRELFGTKRGGTWEWITYKDFGTKVDDLRGGLTALGVKPGDVVAVVANNRVEWAVGAYASFTMGATYVPMYEAQPEKEWEYILKDAGAKVLLVANGGILEKTVPLLDSIQGLEHIIVMDGAAKGPAGKVHTFEDVFQKGKAAPAKPHGVKRDDVACLIYTSGTTGTPKGVILTHGNLANNVSAGREIFPVEATDRSLSFLPWAHSFGQTAELHMLVSGGGSMAIAESVEKIIDNLAEVQPTLLFSVPRIFNKIYTAVQKQLASKPKPIQSLVRVALRAAGKKRNGQSPGFFEGIALSLADKLVFSKVRARFGGRLKYAFSGGAAISREVAEFIDSLGVTVYEGYGLTETSPIATANCPAGRHIGSVGKAIPGVKIVIDASAVADRKTEGTDRVEGEVLVYGHNVMHGYHKRPEENAQVFTGDGGFRTGDMGYLDPQGFLYITGRIKEQYKLENGKYVVPSPLEESLKLSPFVLNAMVYGDNKPFNVGLVVANMDALKDWAGKNGVDAADENALLQSEQVRALFKDEITKYSADFKGFEELRDFALIGKDFTPDNGMLTPSLKLKRRKVMEVYGHLIEALYAKGSKKTAGTQASAA